MTLEQTINDAVQAIYGSMEAVEDMAQAYCEQAAETTLEVRGLADRMEACAQRVAFQNGLACQARIFGEGI